MAALNEELRIEILKRLPIKSLHRIQCVHKPWKSLISSSLFITQHFSFKSSKYNGDDDDDDEKSYIGFSPLYSCFMPSISAVVSYAFFKPPCLVESLKSGSPPVPSGLGCFDVIHGVVCLGCSFGAILWNPAIRKYVEIPTPDDSHVIGFGFSARANEYEFKVISMTKKTTSKPTFEAFSTREGSWRSIGAPPDTVEDDIGDPSSPLIAYGSCFSNGFIHWVVQRHDLRWEILALGCESEEFKIMELPRGFTERNPDKDLTPWHLVGYRGLLASLVWQKSVECLHLDPFEEWIMEEYGIPGSWKKLPTKEREGFVSLSMRDDVDVCVSYLRQKGEETFAWKSIHSIKTSHRVLNSYVFEPSMFLMDVDAQAVSSAIPLC